MRLLGRRTAELHVALAASVDEHTDAGTSPTDTRPEPFTLEWQQLLVELAARQPARDPGRARGSGATRHHADDAGRAIDRAKQADCSPDPPTRCSAHSIDSAPQLVDSVRIRVHGDLHLGQILSTGDDVVFIDFEGEPGLPIEHRLVKRSPLIDLAGLLRSIDYLGRHALRLAEVAGVGARRPRARSRPARRTGRSASPARSSTRTWRRSPRPTWFRPIAPTPQLLLDLYLLDKGLYEIRYELANRPDWVGWPLTAVTEMITTMTATLHARFPISTCTCSTRARIAACTSSSARSRWTVAERGSRCGPRPPAPCTWSATSTGGPARHRSARRASSGVWCGWVEGAGVGTTYRYRVTARTGDSARQVRPGRRRPPPAAVDRLGHRRSSRTSGTTPSGWPTARRAQRARRTDVDLRGAPRLVGAHRARGPALPELPRARRSARRRTASRTASPTSSCCR